MQLEIHHIYRGQYIKDGQPISRDIRNKIIKTLQDIPIC